MKSIRLLRPDDIEVRIQSVNKGGARLLLYKNARVDMSILDETFGPMNWKRQHCRDNQNCIVSVWDEEKGQWISKEDTGTESYMEAQKGLASDSFKRACFNWGIGRELYTAPDIFVFASDLKTFQKGNKEGEYKCFDKFHVSDIQYDGRNIIKVSVVNDSNQKVCTFGREKAKPAKQPATSSGPFERPVTQQEIGALKKAAERKGMDISIIMAMAGVESMEGITPAEYNDMVAVVRSI